MEDKLVEKLSEISTRLAQDFWQNFLDRVKYFPDTDSGNVACIKCIKTALNLIISIYLDGYDFEDKQIELNSLLKEIRFIQNM